MKTTMAVRIELGTFSKHEPESRLESMYSELREFCAELDNQYGGAGYVKINVARKDGEIFRKATEDER